MRTAKTLIRLGDSQADLSLLWAQSQFVGFVMSGLMLNPRHVIHLSVMSVGC